MASSAPPYFSPDDTDKTNSNYLEHPSGNNGIQQDDRFYQINHPALFTSTYFIAPIATGTIAANILKELSGDSIAKMLSCGCDRHNMMIGYITGSTAIASYSAFRYIFNPNRGITNNILLNGIWTGIINGLLWPLTMVKLACKQITID